MLSHDSSGPFLAKIYIKLSFLWTLQKLEDNVVYDFKKDIFSCPIITSMKKSTYLISSHFLA